MCKISGGPTNNFLRYRARGFEKYSFEKNAVKVWLTKNSMLVVTYELVSSSSAI